MTHSASDPLSPSASPVLWRKVERQWPGDAEGQQAYIEFVISLPVQWSQKPKKRRSEVSDDLDKLQLAATKLADQLANMEVVLKQGHVPIDWDLPGRLAADLRALATGIRDRVPAVEDPRFEPPHMGASGAEKAYYARALTLYCLSAVGKPCGGLVVETVSAMLPEASGVDDKTIAALTKDIREAHREGRKRRGSKVLSVLPSG